MRNVHYWIAGLIFEAGALMLDLPNDLSKWTSAKVFTGHMLGKLLLSFAGAIITGKFVAPKGANSNAFLDIEENLH